MTTTNNHDHDNHEQFLQSKLPPLTMSQIQSAPRWLLDDIAMTPSTVTTPSEHSHGYVARERMEVDPGSSDIAEPNQPTTQSTSMGSKCSEPAANQCNQPGQGTEVRSRSVPVDRDSVVGSPSPSVQFISMKPARAENVKSKSSSSRRKPVKSKFRLMKLHIAEAPSESDYKELWKLSIAVVRNAKSAPETMETFQKRYEQMLQQICGHLQGPSPLTRSYRGLLAFLMSVSDLHAEGLPVDTTYQLLQRAIHTFEKVAVRSM